MYCYKANHTPDKILHRASKVGIGNSKVVAFLQ
jgi:hypothetical protein